MDVRRIQPSAPSCGLERRWLIYVSIIAASEWVCVSPICLCVCVLERQVSGMLRRLSDDERPLELCLCWSDDGGAESLSRRQFVLQDNVTNEIAVRYTYT